METVNVQDARRHISELLDRVVDGEEVIIARRGVPIARLSPVSVRKEEFPDRREFRTLLPSADRASSVTVSQLRDDERY